jgi:hypothetical protein
VATREVYHNQAPERFTIIHGAGGAIGVFDTEWRQPVTPCGAGAAGEAAAARLVGLWNRQGPEERRAEMQQTFEEAFA